jgi:uncharacterized RDD family membrane protein YckC
MVTSDRVLSIDTPENVVFGYQLAGLGARFLATLIDTTLIVLLDLLLFIAILFSANMTGALDSDSGAAWVFAIYAFLGFLIFWGYYIVFELVWNGQSPGKRIVKLRVMSIEGVPVTLTGSMLRNLVRIIDFLPPPYGIGVVTMFLSKQSRRLGDYAGGTLVVYDQGAISLQTIKRWEPTITDRLNKDATEMALDLPVARLQPEDIALAEEFLQRGSSLQTEHQLAKRIRDYLYARMDVDTTQVTDGPVASIRHIVSTYHGLQDDSNGAFAANEKTVWSGLPEDEPGLTS